MGPQIFIAGLRWVASTATSLAMKMGAKEVKK
jgi:hypothetical protein